MNNSKYFYDVGEDGTLKKVPRERELSVPESMCRPRPDDPDLAALNDGELPEVKKSERDFRRKAANLQNQQELYGFASDERSGANKLLQNAKVKLIAQKKVAPGSEMFGTGRANIVPRSLDGGNIDTAAYRIRHPRIKEGTGLNFSPEESETRVETDYPHTNPFVTQGRKRPSKKQIEYVHGRARKDVTYRESEPKPFQVDKSFGNAQDHETGFGVNSEGFLSRQHVKVGKEEQGQRKKHDGFRAQDDYDAEDLGRVVTPAPGSKTSKRSTDPHVGPVKKPERLDLWTESTDDASLRFK